MSVHLNVRFSAITTILLLGFKAHCLLEPLELVYPWVIRVGSDIHVLVNILMASPDKFRCHRVLHVNVRFSAGPSISPSYSWGRNFVTADCMYLSRQSMFVV